MTDFYSLLGEEKPHDNRLAQAWEKARKTLGERGERDSLKVTALHNYAVNCLPTEPERSLAIFKSNYETVSADGKNTDALIHTVYGMAQAHSALSQSEEAVGWYEKLLPMLEENGKASSTLAFLIFRRAAEEYEKAGNNDRAKQLREKMKAVRSSKEL